MHVSQKSFTLHHQTNIAQDIDLGFACILYTHSANHIKLGGFFLIFLALNQAIPTMYITYYTLNSTTNYVSIISILMHMYVCMCMYLHVISIITSRRRYIRMHMYSMYSRARASLGYLESFRPEHHCTCTLGSPFFHIIEPSITTGKF